MKINSRVIYLPILFIVLIVMASNIAVVDALEAGKLTKVTSDVTYGNPVWSPDGNEILFVRDAGDYKNELYKIFSDGSGEKKLISDISGYGYTWSPDGRKISCGQFTDDEYGVFNYDIWIMNADGTKKTHLLGPVGDLGFISYAWFPSGSKIAYAIGRDDVGSLGVINSDGSNNHDVYGFANSEIALSPDASKIACNIWDFDPYSPNEIYVYDLKQNKDYSHLIGSIVQQTQSWQPEVWSPDGKKIVYWSNENGNSDIYTIKADGTGKTQLTSDLANDENSIFSPDGKKILYISDKAGNDDIWVMDADGKNKVQLTTDSADDSYPAWSPDGKKIAFYSERGGDHAIYSLTLESEKSPVADFSASKTLGNAPLKVTFTDKSTGAPTSWKWSFGDGSALTTGYNPTHTYSKAGIYTVKETVSNAAGKDTEIKIKYITVTSPIKPVAAFSATPTSGNVPLKVKFTDKSKGSPTSWKWTFGDGTSSTVKNSAHTYSKAGKYTVSLTVKNAAGTNTKTIKNYIVANELKAPVAAFSASPTSGNVPLKVKFTDKSAGSPTSWKWNFGDGTYSTKKNPSYTYDEAGKYKVSLTVKNAKGSNTKTVSGYITVSKK